MALYINTNISSITARKHLNRTQQAMNRSMERLSTGMRINRAADDASGLALSDHLRADITCLNQARRNANDGISLLQTAEGALEEISTNLIRIRELAVQAANGVLSDDRRNYIHQEFTALISDIERIADVTEFADIGLINGGAAAGVDFQIGINATADSQITATIQDMRPDQLGTTSLLSNQSVSTMAAALDSLAVIDEAIETVVATRSDIGAVTNQLSSAIANLETSVENLSAANTRIREVDVAAETAELTRVQILMQAGVSVLAQANSSPQYALALLGAG